MGVTNGQQVSAEITNPAFLDANDNDQALGKIDFANTDAASGPTVVNTQREQNSLNSFTGRPAGTAYNATPVWTNNDVGSSGDNLKQRAEALTAEFDNATGHNHSGGAGEGGQIPASALASVPLKGYIEQGLTLTGVTGTSVDVSTELSGKSSSAGPTAVGVVTTPPYNKVVLRQGSGPDEDDQFVSGAGDVVYARLTNSLSVWTLSFYTLVSGTETAYNFLTAVDIKWYFQELFNPMVNPPVYSEFATIPSDNPTEDVLDATTTQKGKVQLATAVQPVGSTGSAGTANAIVANADHVHEGVHAIKIDGNPYEAKGDVTIEPGTGITLSWNGGKLKIVGAGAVAYQETPAGTVDGVNTVFGPLTYLPSDNDSVLVFIDYLAVPKSGFSVSGSTITFNAGWIPQNGQSVYAFYCYSGTPSVPVVTGTFRVENRTITSGEAIAKSLSLSFTPANPSYVMLDVIGGGPQFFGSDFSVTGSTLSWNGLALDGVLDTGDRLRISYVT